MYINIQKIGRVIGVAIGCLLAIFGSASYAFALTAQAQISSILVAIFGLQLLWFVLWLGRK